MTSADRPLSAFDVQILLALRDVAASYPKSSLEWSSLQDEGWVTSAQVREELGSKSLETRQALKHLAVEGTLSEMFDRGIQMFRLSGKGERALAAMQSMDRDLNSSAGNVESRTWTGTISPIQAYQVLQVVSEFEDVAESITDNMNRAQIMGLISAIKILIELPEPPREGIIQLIRDPAFANIVQIGTFLAAVIAAIN
ncbi:hypothetical protein [Blastomonas sp.]|uniref:hypothetical protein n=1 Tax=Blastomonas sp. TaxID=1909299 RepID=UPI00391DC9B2